MILRLLSAVKQNITGGKVFFDKKRGKIIFITGLLVFLLIAFLVNRSYIGSDGRSYQRLAVNIAEGNGYSSNTKPPFERQFFREPGYPYFFSIACNINKLLGNENLTLSYYDAKPGYYEGAHIEILILRILQALIASLSVWLFYKTLLFFLKPQLAGLISILFIFYIPFSIFITFPQREILVTTLLIGMGYLFLKSATLSKSLWFDITFGILAVALVMTLQVYVFILPLFLLSHIVITKNLKKSLKSLAIISFVFIIGVAPWSYRGYLEAKDLRVLKTFGVSYTYEFKKFHDANAKAYKLNLGGNGEVFINRIIDGYSEPGKLMFEKSFNAYYLNYADSLNGVINSEAYKTKIDWFKYNIREVIINNYRKALLWPLWKPDYRKDISTILNEDGNRFMLVSIVIGIIIGFIALIGIILFIGKTWYYMPVFIFHFLMIPFIADEGRHVLPFLPFYFMFFILSSDYIFNTAMVRLGHGKMVNPD
jgi:ABC-type multidrug transport system fused ATPase/permease subunit